MIKHQKEDNNDSNSNTSLIDALLQENNLKRRQIPNVLTQFCLSYQQRNETYGVSVNSKFSMFKNNLRLFSEYSSTPSKIAFEKINLKVVSNLFSKKVILYFTTEDQFLNSIIANNKYEDTIQIVRIGNHYDLVYSTELFTSYEICQTIIYQTFNSLFSDNNTIASLQFINIELLYDETNCLNQIEEEETESPYLNTFKRLHKKSQSLSNLQFESKHFKETSFDLFAGLKIPKDFLKTLQNVTPTQLLQNNEKDTQQQKRSPRMAFYENDSIQESQIAPQNSIIRSPRSPQNDTRIRMPTFNEPQLYNPVEHSPSFAQQHQTMFSPNYDQHQASLPFDLIKQEPDLIQQEFNKMIPMNTINSPQQQQMFAPYSQTQGSPSYWNYMPQQQQQQSTFTSLSQNQQKPAKKPPIILDESKQRFEGQLKFFDETKNYGFLVMDTDQSDIFVHFDDLAKIGISKEFLKRAKLGCIIRFSFCCLEYVGKYKKSRKAVDLELLPSLS